MARVPHSRVNYGHTSAAVTSVFVISSRIFLAIFDVNIFLLPPRYVIVVLLLLLLLLLDVEVPAQLVGHT